MDDEPLRRTALFDVHRTLGARIVPFGGFEMPVQYAGILAEHAAVRERAGLFDLSHMAQFELRGTGVAAWADALTINHVATMKPFQARYNVFTNDAGGTHDDVLFYRLPDRWLLIVNAGNAHKMWEYLQAECRGDVQLTDLRGESALLAVQGPRSVEVLAPLVEADIAALKYYTCAETRAGGARAVVARTGYTGEDGFEVFLPADAAVGLWDALLVEHRSVLAPCGLGARDVLRLEAGMPLYGHELTEEITPLQAGLGWAVKFAKPSFTGKAALEAQAVDEDYPRIAGLVLDGRVPARAGYRVLRNGAVVGEIRSGSIAPSIGNKSIATALLEPSSATVGTRLGVEVRGTEHPATTVALPFYKRG
ncbi:MAG: glycine cleavage system aminomethyltransferase GcvT [Candidatus Lustribacter sp.]|jgi:aminomethyltransferase